MTELLEQAAQREKEAKEKREKEEEAQRQIELSAITRPPISDQDTVSQVIDEVSAERDAEQLKTEH